MCCKDNNITTPISNKSKVSGIGFNIKIKIQGDMMIIIRTKKQILWSLVIAVVSVGIGCVLHFKPFFETFGFREDTDLRVIIDAGHGLPDGGAVGKNGTVEQSINLDVALKTAEVLEGKGIEVILTRDSQECLCKEQEGKTLRQIKREDMNERLAIMQKSDADLFISIHMNYFESEEASGLRLFYDANHEQIKPFAEYIQQNISEITKARVYAVKAADKSLFLMKNPPVASILVECGFISNPEEEKKLNSEEYRAKIAWALADAVEKYYNNCL